MTQIRRALPADAETLSRIAIAAKRHWQYPERWMDLWLPQLTFAPEYFEIHESWVVEQERLPVAFSTLEERDDAFWVENMWVMPEYMGMGMGRKLFLHAVELARQRGFNYLQLEAEPNAVGFYEKMGLRTIGQHQYELDGQPRILPLMEISL